MLSGFVLARNARFSFTNRLLSFNVYKLCRLNFGSDALAYRKNILKTCRNVGVISFHSRYYAGISGISFLNHVKNTRKILKNWLFQENKATELYRTQEFVDLNEFYSCFGLPDTFNSWFVVVELHTWMLLSQLKIDNREELRLRNNVVKAFWFDVETRLKGLPSKQKIITKQLRELCDRFPITLCIYDEGLFSNDTVLAGALWYKFFDKCCDDPRKLEILVSYVRHQVQHLSVLGLASNTNPPTTNIWLPLAPHIKAVSLAK